MSSELAALRNELKDWERQFQRRHQRMPSSADISGHPEMEAKYVAYRKLKAQSGQDRGSHALQAQTGDSGRHEHMAPARRGSGGLACKRTSAEADLEAPAPTARSDDPYSSVWDAPRASNLLSSDRGAKSASRSSTPSSAPTAPAKRARQDADWDELEERDMSTALKYASLPVVLKKSPSPAVPRLGRPLKAPPAVSATAVSARAGPTVSRDTPDQAPDQAPDSRPSNSDTEQAGGDEDVLIYSSFTDANSSSGDDENLNNSFDDGRDGGGGSSDDYDSDDDDDDDDNDGLENMDDFDLGSFVKPMQVVGLKFAGPRRPLVAVPEYDVDVEGARDAELEEHARREKQAALEVAIKEANALMQEQGLARGRDDSGKAGPNRGQGTLAGAGFVRLNLRNRNFRRGARNKKPKSKLQQLDERKRLLKKQEEAEKNTDSILHQPFHAMDVDALESAKGGVAHENAAQSSPAPAAPSASSDETDAELDGDGEELEFEPESLSTELLPASGLPKAKNTAVLERIASSLECGALDLKAQLQELFGFPDFRQSQEAAIRRVLQAMSTLVVLSTGAGKSLCFQLPAFIFAYFDAGADDAGAEEQSASAEEQSASDEEPSSAWRRGKSRKRQSALRTRAAKRANAITLVVSPLLSLIEDQLLRLPKGLPGACLHSGMSAREKERVSHLILEGKVAVLYVAPETLVTETFLQLACSKAFPPIAFACVDEAHCVSEWSHNFRPAYLRLGEVLRTRLGVACVLALTATATRTCIESVCAHLSIPPDGLISGSPVPRNLVLAVSHETDKDDALVALLAKREPFASLTSVIVYCSRQADADRVAMYLRIHGLVAQSYHAGMTSRARTKVQRGFMTGAVKIIVATIAFGMGLDKPDVRGVVHYNLPGSFEGYVQEIGRAGRDGCVSHCHAFVHKADFYHLRTHAYSNTVDPNVVKKLLQMVFGAQAFSSPGEDTGPPTGAQAGKAVYRAVCLSSASLELDAKPEVLETILHDLAKHKFIELLPRIQKTCLFYSRRSLSVCASSGCPGSVLARVIAESAAPVSPDAVNTDEQKRPWKRSARPPAADAAQGAHTTIFAIDLPSVATATSVSISAVRREIMAMRDAALGDRVDFQDWSVLFSVVRAPSSKELDELMDVVVERMEEMEQCQLGKVEAVYERFMDVIQQNQNKAVRHMYPLSAKEQQLTDKYRRLASLPLGNLGTADGDGDDKDGPLSTAADASWEAGASGCAALNELVRAQVESYFASGARLHGSTAGSADESQQQGTETANPAPGRACSPAEELAREFGVSSVSDVDAVRREIRQLIASTKIMNGRAIARILQGIQSPRFAAKDWYSHPCWAKYVELPFNLLRKLALLEMISVVKK